MLYSNPPHRVTTYTSEAGEDAGGGVKITYTAAQADLPCSISTAGAAEQERFAMMQQVVTHTIGVLTSAITVPVVPGMKVVTADRTESYHVKGISAGRQYGNIPSLTYLYCEQLL